MAQASKPGAASPNPPPADTKKNAPTLRPLRAAPGSPDTAPAPPTPPVASPGRAPLSPYAREFQPHEWGGEEGWSERGAPALAFSLGGGGGLPPLSPHQYDCYSYAAAAVTPPPGAVWPLFTLPPPHPAAAFSPPPPPPGLGVGVALPVPCGFTPCPPLPAGGLGPPTRTLFVGNLDGGVAPAEVRAAFAPCPGFRGIKVEPARTGAGSIAFADFATQAEAGAAIAARQGALLATNARGGLRLSYARAPLRTGAW